MKYIVQSIPIDNKITVKLIFKLNEEEKKLTPQQLRKNIFLKGWKVLNNNKRRLAMIMNRKSGGFYIIFFIIILLYSFLYKDSRKKRKWQ